MRYARYFALTLIGVLTLTACNGENPTNHDGIIRLVVGRMAAGVDPADDLSSSYLRMYGASEALAKFQADGSVEPELAENIARTGEDEWTVTLREDATFWSGAPVDSAAVVASYQRTLEQSTMAKGLIGNVELTTPDDRTVVLRTEGPSPYLDYALAHYTLTIHNVESYKDANPTDPGIADLTGPFQITGFATERSVELARNDNWWGGPVAAPGVRVTLVQDEQSRAEIAMSGQADIIESFPSGRGDEAKSRNLQLISAQAATTVTVYLNPNSPQAPALADQRVRQALAWGTDRDSVVALATNGLATPLSSWLASNPGFPEAAQRGFVSYDLQRATALLDEAGWLVGSSGIREKEGEPLQIRLLTFGAEGPTGEVLQAQWRELGVDLQVRNVEANLVTQSLKNGDWDAVTQAWTTLGNVPALIGTQIRPDGAANHGRYNAPGVVELLDAAVTAPDANTRDNTILDVNDIIIDVVPLIPVHTRVAAVALGENVTGFVPHPLQYETIIRADMTVN